MGDTSISWTDKTWNPVRGCSKVSAGCINCYAESVAARFCGPGLPYEGLAIGKRWTGEVRTVPEHLADPLRWRKPVRVFVNSMSDLFHEKLSNEQIAAVFGVMAAAPRHTFQVLTKRPERMLEWFRWIEEQRVVDGDPWVTILREATCSLGGDSTWDRHARENLAHHGEFDVPHPWPLPNVWLGTSVENQPAADDRIKYLRATPAAVRFLSIEPLLGPVDVSSHLWPVHWSWSSEYRTPEEAIAAGAYAERKRQALVSAHAGFIDWVIAGCESGPGMRPCDPTWLASLRDQCAAAGVAYFLKQGVDPGGPAFGCQTITAGEGSKVKARGVIELPYLDGVQHAAFPETR